MPRKKNQVPGQINLLLTTPEPTTAKNKRDRKKLRPQQNQKLKNWRKKQRVRSKILNQLKTYKKRTRSLHYYRPIFQSKRLPELPEKRSTHRRSIGQL